VCTRTRRKLIDNVQCKRIFLELLKGQEEKVEELQNKEEIL
jgi:hypothetical protein